MQKNVKAANNAADTKELNNPEVTAPETASAAGNQNDNAQQPESIIKASPRGLNRFNNNKGN